MSNTIDFNNDKTYRATPLTTPFDRIYLQMSVYPVINLQVLRCDTPIAALAKIGGLLFVMRISVLLSLVHEWIFNCKMRQRYPKKKKPQRIRQVSINADGLASMVVPENAP